MQRSHLSLLPTLLLVLLSAPSSIPLPLPLPTTTASWSVPPGLPSAATTASPKERCPGVAIRDLSELNASTFGREFRGRRPVLLRRSPSLLRAARLHWSRAALLDCCASTIVQVGLDARSIVTNHGEGARNMTLGEYIHTFTGIPASAAGSGGE